jgi:hypothetical protein
MANPGVIHTPNHGRALRTAAGLTAALAGTGAAAVLGFNMARSGFTATEAPNPQGDLPAAPPVAGATTSPEAPATTAPAETTPAFKGCGIVAVKSQAAKVGGVSYKRVDVTVQGAPKGGKESVPKQPAALNSLNLARAQAEQVPYADGEALGEAGEIKGKPAFRTGTNRYSVFLHPGTEGRPMVFGDETVDEVSVEITDRGVTCDNGKELFVTYDENGLLTGVELRGPGAPGNQAPIPQSTAVAALPPQ